MILFLSTYVTPELYVGHELFTINESEHFPSGDLRRPDGVFLESQDSFRVGVRSVYSPRRGPSSTLSRPSKTLR